MATAVKNLTVSILIPCHNEELSIRKCIASCLAQSEPPDTIVVVDDGSLDRSNEYLREFGSLITLVTIPKSNGKKSYAQEYGLPYVTGDLLIVTDGDTVLDADFVKEMKRSFADPEVGAVSGYVKSIPYNYLTAFREFEYFMGQNIHKRAQSNIDFLAVIPGCAGGFRTELFKRTVAFDHDTLTEDLDFTYKIHKTGYRIAFNEKAIAYTQDPHTLSDYLNQMRRWYAGAWQNLRKHVNIIENPRGAFELSLMYIEGLLATTLFFLVPFVNFILFTKLIVAYLGVVLAIALYISFRRGRIDIFLWSPLFVVLMFFNAYIFLEQFTRQILFKEKSQYWFQPQRRSL